MQAGDIARASPIAQTFGETERDVGAFLKGRDRLALEVCDLGACGLGAPSTFFAEFSRTARRRAYFGASAITPDRPFGGVIDMLGRLADLLPVQAVSRGSDFVNGLLGERVHFRQRHMWADTQRITSSLAGRSFNFVYFSSSVPTEVSRLREGGFFARNTRRNPVVIEVVSIEDFPFRHRAIPPDVTRCGPGSCRPQYRIECH